MLFDPVLPLQQHPRFASAMAAMGARMTDAPLTGGGAVQIVQRFGLRAALRGPVWADFVPHHQRRQDLMRARLHLANPDSSSPIWRQEGFWQSHHGAWVAELTLDAQIIARMHGKWRNRWRKAQRGNLQITTSGWSQRHGWLLQRDAQQQRKAGFRALPHALITAYASTGPDAVQVYCARQNHQIIAAMIFLRHGAAVTYHLGWTDAVGRDLGAHHLILIQAAFDYARTGALRLDLGVVDTHNNAGLARFKIGSGATLRQLGGTWLARPWPFAR
jgi:hypothetical protein